MNEPYTPTTKAVRTAIWTSHLTLAEFDRWLAAHDREVREQVAQEIEAVRDDADATRPRTPGGVGADHMNDMTWAAYIARGESA